MFVVSTFIHFSNDS